MKALLALLVGTVVVVVVNMVTQSPAGAAPPRPTVVRAPGENRPGGIPLGVLRGD